MPTFAFVFDMDGVIVDSNPYHKIALQQFCQRLGFHLDEPAMIHHIYGRTNKEWIGNLLGSNISPEQLRQYATEKELLYQELYRAHIRPLAGLHEFLQLLVKQHIPRAIATSAPRMNVDFTLHYTGLGSFFDVILDESHVQHGKPHPEIYIKTAEALQLPPERCIVFEDSLSGVAAAQAAGCKVVGVLTTHRAAELAHAHMTIKDFTNLQPEQIYCQINLS
ncbi:MAG: HAD family phosphatase [Cytophagales bacterium]|nr:HAD family phosphatase [Bernardetiaceae bacterium]MDW8203519.1 HAD family phosphatase [Cytophagales bacterium]